MATLENIEGQLDSAEQEAEQNRLDAEAAAYAAAEETRIANMRENEESLNAEKAQWEDALAIETDVRNNPDGGGFAGVIKEIG